MSPNVNPLETLMAEHRQIERALAALEACARQIEGGDEVAPGALSRFARFLRGYADDLHHGKEEALLFEKMIDAGFPRDAGPVAMMRLEHERGRALVRELKGLGEKDAWSPADRRRTVEVSFEFAALLRGHILKEDRILYPMAEQRMTPEAMARLAEECHAHLQKNLEVEGDLVELAASLEQEFISRDRTPAAAAHRSDHAATCPLCGGHAK
ncbi:MAG TPA: hemerythrin domain-containing protein [Myxococcales bacterium]